jgi:hypothetical protein
MPPPFSLYLVFGESRLRKSDLEFLEIDGSVAGTRVGWGERREVLDFGKGVAGCVHINSILSLATDFTKKRKEGKTDQYKPPQS